jgi:hypothetical protein
LWVIPTTNIFLCFPYFMFIYFSWPQSFFGSRALYDTRHMGQWLHKVSHFIFCFISKKFFLVIMTSNMLLPRINVTILIRLTARNHLLLRQWWHIIIRK